MPAKQVRVSVVVPCHNSAGYLADALRSVAEQTLSDFECIVIDDASSDASRDVAAQFAVADRRFSLVALDENRGAGEARNIGIAQTRGRWIAPLDADDLFLPDRLERLVELGEREGADMVIDDLLIARFPSHRPLHHAFGFEAAAVPFTQEVYFARSRIFQRYLAIGYMKPLISRQLIERTSARYPADTSGEDFLFYAELLCRGGTAVATAYAGYVYRERRGSLSRSDEHLHQLAAQSDRLLTKQADSLSPDSQAALQARKRDFLELIAAGPALTALHGRQPMRLLWSLAKRPRTIGIGLRLLRSKLQRLVARYEAARIK